MPFARWFKRPRRVLAVFLTVATVSAVTLGALTWWLLLHYRDLEAQRQVQRLEDLLGTAPTAKPLPPHVAAISITGDRLVTAPLAWLLYYPAPMLSPSPAAVDAFDEGEHLELVTGDNTRAVTVYTRLAARDDPAVRAGALMRLGRVHRKQKAFEQALGDYASLAALGDVAVEGWPASFVAQLGQLDVFKAVGPVPMLERAAADLLRGLQRGQWHLTKAQYETYAATARASLPNAPGDDPEEIARAELVEWLWQRRGVEAAVTRSDVALSSGTALVVWRSTPSELYGVVAGPAYLETPGVDPRRTLLVLVLGLVVGGLSAGWFFIYRELQRERRLADLQSDFVAAVSHEFRSPLTALSHAAELLAGDRLTSEPLRRQTYGVLQRDTSRLRALVENLLEFGRLEAGESPFHFENTDVGALVRETVAEVQSRVADSGYVITQTPTGAAGHTHAAVDREAVKRALQNLLDNAVKYSPESHDIAVELTEDAGMLSIAVRDHGIGIPADEQASIFDRFVRGAESKSRRIQGTGIGLALVRQIVRAHGGEVDVSSVPGEGSVFTITLPVQTPSDEHPLRRPVALAAADSPRRGRS